jgi:site-specific recombinase XerD
MLTELGVLAPPEDEVDRQITTLLSQIDYSPVREFVGALKKKNTASKTIARSMHILKEFNLWLIGKNKNIMTVDKHMFGEYFIALKNCKLHRKRKTYLQLKKFYHWCFINSHISKTPVPTIPFTRPPSRILICNEEDFLSLKKYIKDEKSDAEAALLLCLILFWGFTTVELAQAQLIIKEDEIFIKSRRKRLTKGKQFHNRPELLTLPKEPKWLLSLQQRFVKRWQEHYVRVKKTYPLTPLVLSNSYHCNRYLHTDVIRKRVWAATYDACGVKIPLRVLKQTCGHLYAKNADTSILTGMGWSPQFAFHYNWMPRVLYAENKSTLAQQG